MEVWPAIDLRAGKCVRLRQGDYAQETVFGDDPAAMAVRWVQEGASRLHLVDLDGARSGAWTNQDAVCGVLKAVDVPCQLGGGIRNEETIGELLGAGLSRLVIGTRALQDPEWLARMSRAWPGKLVVGIDARDGRVATDGWQNVSDVSAASLAQSVAELPLAAIVYTDIARDGMMAGPNFDAMSEMQRAVQLPVVASGGVTQASDVSRLAEIGMAGCIIGRALYEGTLTVKDAIDAAQRD